ncbi:hypothetical protein DFH09DRAFT_1451294 [Mycena vulgaris]|nr:hypothetical protein DFH09DRAFT_1451294 [Mycena vulgaris]
MRERHMCWVFWRTNYLPSSELIEDSGRAVLFTRLAVFKTLMIAITMFHLGFVAVGIGCGSDLLCGGVNVVIISNEHLDVGLDIGRDHCISSVNIVRTSDSLVQMCASGPPLVIPSPSASPSPSSSSASVTTMPPTNTTPLNSMTTPSHKAKPVPPFVPEHFTEQSHWEMRGKELVYRLGHFIDRIPARLPEGCENTTKNGTSFIEDVYNSEGGGCIEGVRRAGEIPGVVARWHSRANGNEDEETAWKGLCGFRPAAWARFRSQGVGDEEGMRDRVLGDLYIGRPRECRDVPSDREGHMYGVDPHCGEGGGRDVSSRGADALARVVSGRMDGRRVDEEMSEAARSETASTAYRGACRGTRVRRAVLRGGERASYLVLRTVRNTFLGACDGCGERGASAGMTGGGVQALSAMKEG